jgi:hypothetical protein
MALQFSLINLASRVFLGDLIFSYIGSKVVDTKDEAIDYLFIQSLLLYCIFDKFFTLLIPLKALVNIEFVRLLCWICLHYLVT